MVRQVFAAAGALVSLVALASAPTAAAADGDQLVLAQGGTLQCLVSANNVPRGGGSMVVCQHSDGTPWTRTIPATNMNSAPLTVAVKKATGQFYWATGTATDPKARAAASSQGMSIGTGQSVNINGWTITGEPSRTRFANDASGHGYYVSVPEVIQF